MGCCLVTCGLMLSKGQESLRYEGSCIPRSRTYSYYCSCRSVAHHPSYVCNAYPIYVYMCTIWPLVVHPSWVWICSIKPLISQPSWVWNFIYFLKENLYIIQLNNDLNYHNVCSTIGIIRVQVGFYHKIVYSASVFNILNPLGFASGFNILNHLGFIDYFMINTSCPLIIPIIFYI